jgi:hypothetical protein
MSQRFLLVVWDGGGTIPPLMGVARRLCRRGHHVTVMSDSVVEPEARAAGADFVSFTHAPNRTGRGREHDPIRDWEGGSPITMIGKMRDHPMCGRHRATRATSPTSSHEAATTPWRSKG